jgi:hypothetical protein
LNAGCVLQCSLRIVDAASTAPWQERHSELDMMISTLGILAREGGVTPPTCRSARHLDVLKSFKVWTAEAQP